MVGDDEGGVSGVWIPMPQSYVLSYVHTYIHALRYLPEGSERESV